MPRKVNSRSAGSKPSAVYEITRLITVFTRSRRSPFTHSRRVTLEIAPSHLRLASIRLSELSLEVCFSHACLLHIQLIILDFITLIAGKSCPATRHSGAKGRGGIAPTNF